MKDELNQHKKLAMGMGPRTYAKGGGVAKPGAEATQKVGKMEPRKAPPMPKKGDVKPGTGNPKNAIPAFKSGGKIGGKRGC